jgi:hypothetical protein
MEPDIQFEREVPPRDLRLWRWIARWREQRQHGRLSYVLRYGILLRGVFFATLMTLARWFGVLGTPHRDKPWLLVVGFLFYAIFFGLLSGSTAWRRNEKRFQTITEATPIV